LKEQVMNLAIPPGAHINIGKLAGELQVSSTPLREALALLEAEGPVTRRNLRGYWTAGLLDQPGGRNLYAVRLLLDRSAAEVAAQGEDTEPLTAAVEKTPDDMAQSAGLPALDYDYHRYRDFVEADGRFRNAIAVAFGNSLIANILAGRNAHARNYRLCSHGGIADATLSEHRVVQDAPDCPRSGRRHDDSHPLGKRQGPVAADRRTAADDERADD
jgi:DNA-binding GntR family transcriptional regulator